MNATKKSGNPSRPGYRYAVPDPIQGKRRPILKRIWRKCKHVYWERVALFLLFIVGIIYIISLAVGAVFAENGKTETETPPPTPTITATPTPTPTPIEYIFRDGDGQPIDVQSMTSAWAAEAGTAKRYELTDAERWEVASVVTAEAAGEPYAGKVAVAQCILQACEDDGIRPTKAVVKYSYAKSRPEPTEEALKAVQAVFDLGQVATSKPIKFFYAPARCSSSFHESQDFVMVINNHKFFAEVK